jgi:hypothetical protein
MTGKGKPQDKDGGWFRQANDEHDSELANCYAICSIAASLIRIGDLLEKAQEKRDADSEQAFNTALHAVSGQ